MEAYKVKTFHSAKTILKPVFLVISCVALLIMSSKFHVHLGPVPMTLQVLAVYFISFTGGSRLAVLSILSYVLIGAMGFPVFSDSPQRGIGLAYLAGPTTGYLVGFIIAAWILGEARSASFIVKAFVSGIALVIIYACGVLWLWQFVPTSQLINVGILPFLLNDVLKVTFALLTAQTFNLLRQKWGK